MPPETNGLAPPPGPPAGVESPAAPANLVVIGLILAVAVTLVSRLADPLGVRTDSWSEAQVIISGIGYSVSGFFAYAGLPQHQIGPPVDPYFLYANYPVLSNFLYGILLQIGAEQHGLYRLPAIMASLLAVWLWYRLVARVVDRPTAVAATVALASSFEFLTYADNIHQQAYPLAPQLGALLCLVIGVASETVHRSAWLLGSAVCLLLVSLLTLELYLWLMIAMFGYVLLFGSAVRWRWLLLLALPLCVGLGIQWFQNWAGLPTRVEERPGIVDSLYRRSIGFAAALDTPLDANRQRLSLTTYPAFMLSRFRELYLLPVWVVPVLMLFSYVGAGPPTWSPKGWPAQFKLLAILLVAGLGWMGTMMQQTAVHPATMRQLLPFYALLLGVTWTQAIRAGLDARRNLVWRCVLSLVALATLVPHFKATWSNIRMHLDHAYIHPTLMEPGWEESADLAPLHELPEHSVLLTNHGRVPLIRYWSRRPTYLAPRIKVSVAGSAERSWLDDAELSARSVRRQVATAPLSVSCRSSSSASIGV